MTRLILDPSWSATPKTKIPVHAVELGDGYGIQSDVFRVVDDDYQVEKSGIPEHLIEPLILQLRQFAGVDKFDWSPDIARYPLKAYRMPNHIVTRIGLGYYKISASLRRIVA